MQIEDKCHIEAQCELTLEGCITNLCIEDTDCPPNNIIKRTDPFLVRVGWWIDGTVVSLLGGEFNIKACFESIGPGLEASFGPVVVPVSSGASVSGHPLRRAYSVDIPVDPKNLDGDAYKMISVITYKNNGHPGNIAGYSDETVVQIYEPDPNQT